MQNPQIGESQVQGVRRRGVVQRLRKLLGRVEIRILLLLTCGALLASLVLVFAQTAKPVTSEASFETVSAWDDLVKKYLLFREFNYAMVAPGWYLNYGETKRNLNEYGLEAFQKEPDWYWNFDGGVLVFDAKSALAKLVKSGTQVVIFEDMANQELLVLGAPEKEGGEYREEIAFRAPAWPEVSKDEDYGRYLWKELSKRRVAWRVTLKSKAIAEKELAAQAVEQALAPLKDSGGGRMMLMMAMQEYSNHLWISIQGPAWGMTNVEVSAHVPDGFTNRIEVFSCTNLTGFSWALAATNLSTEGTNTVSTTYDPSNATGPVFFAIGNADVDSDADGLKDAREKFVHHTDPNAVDTDEDGMPDGWEVDHALNPIDAADAGSDPDGDGLANVEEFQLGTDPHNYADGAALLAQARSTITQYWGLVHSQPLAFTNTPGSAADLNDLKNALMGMSGTFYKAVTE